MLALVRTLHCQIGSGVPGYRACVCWGNKQYFVPFSLIVHVLCEISFFHLSLERDCITTTESDGLISFTIHRNNCESCENWFVPLLIPTGLICNMFILTLAGKVIITSDFMNKAGKILF